MKGITADDRLAVQAHNVVRVYGELGEEVVALRGADLSIPKGERVAVLGPSGSGKSTLLWLCAGLQRPTAGQLFLDGQSLVEMNERALSRLRATSTGLLLQNPSRNLLTWASASDNLTFAQRTSRATSAEKSQRARDLLARVGLDHVAGHQAGSLSGGEQQRLALAVALVNRPTILLADEPTSQLDHESAERITHLIAEHSREEGTAVLVVTHDPVVAKAMGRTVTIRDGRIGAEGDGEEEFMVVGRHGELHLPAEVLELLPPGSLARAERHPDGVLIRPAVRQVRHERGDDK